MYHVLYHVWCIVAKVVCTQTIGLYIDQCWNLSVFWSIVQTILWALHVCLGFLSLPLLNIYVVKYYYKIIATLSIQHLCIRVAENGFLSVNNLYFNQLYMATINICQYFILEITYYIK